MQTQHVGCQKVHFILAETSRLYVSLADGLSERRDESFLERRQLGAVDRRLRRRGDQLLKRLNTVLEHERFDMTLDLGGHVVPQRLEGDGLLKLGVHLEIHDLRK